MSPDTPAPDATIDVPAACLLTRMGREQFMRLVFRGVIPGRRVLGRWQLDRAAVEAVVQKRAANSAGGPPPAAA